MIVYVKVESVFVINVDSIAKGAEVANERIASCDTETLRAMAREAKVLGVSTTSPE